MVVFACQRCGQGLKAQEEQAGKMARCPRCSQLTPIPHSPVAVKHTVDPSAPPAVSGQAGTNSPNDSLADDPGEAATLPPSAPAPVPSGVGNGSVSPEEEAATLPPAEGGTVTFDHPSTAPASAGPGALRLAGYEVLGELGRGGMGVVYKARDLRLKRLAALKMVLAGGHAGQAELARFRTEAEAVARLQHPNIVQIHEVGTHDGLPFFALEFCPGGSLADQLDGTPLPAGRAAGLVETLARAMEAAHRAGVLHRDLKPGNVLLAEDGTPKVTDFGLARKLDEAGQTATGVVMGTPSYMAPEQAGGHKDIGPACDVYALGAILYELLTGRPPFKAATPLDTVLQVVSDEPVPPRQLQPRTPRDLETICLKCLHKEPGKRYPSAAALAEDLRRFLAHEPIRARPVGAAERVLKWMKRRPAAAALLTVSVASAVLLLAGGLYFMGELHSERNAALRQQERAEKGEADALAQKARAEKGEGEALAQKQRANKARGEAEEQTRQVERQRQRAEIGQYGRWLGLAQYEERAGNVSRALELLDATPAPLRHWEYAYLRRLSQRLVGTLPVHPLPLSSLAFHPDGTQLATPWDRSVRVWDCSTGRPVLTLAGHTVFVSAVAYSPDGKCLASAGADLSVRLWDARSGRPLRTLTGHPAAVLQLAFSSDGKRLFSLDLAGVIKVWDAEAGKVLHSLKAQDKRTLSPVFSPDGKHLASAGADRVVRIQDVATGRDVQTLAGHLGPVASAAFSPDGKRLLTGSADRTVKMWDLAAGKAVQTLEGHAAAVEKVLFCPDGKRAVSSSADSTLRVWDLSRGETDLTFVLPRTPGAGIDLSPDGRVLASASVSRTVQLWELAPREPALPLRSHADDVLAVAFAPDGRRLATASLDKTVRLWDLPGGRHALTLQGHTGAVRALAFDRGGRLASASDDGTIKVWDPGTGRAAQTLRGHANGVQAVAFSPDGRRLASGSFDGSMKVWDPATAQAVATLKRSAPGKNPLAESMEAASQAQDLVEGLVGGLLGDEAPFPEGKPSTLGGVADDIRMFSEAVGSVAFSPDGKRLAGMRGSGLIEVWDLAGGREAFSLQAADRMGLAFSGPLAFSPDGKQLAAGTDREVYLWDLATRRPLVVLKGHTERVTGVCFSPDGKRLATASHDKSLRLWDPVSGQELFALRGHGKGLHGLAFSRDGKRLATASADRIARVWDAGADTPP